MRVKILNDKLAVGRAAAGQAANSLRRALREKSTARLVAATGASQIEFLETLIAAPDIDWSRVEVFHLDEYVGLPVTHPASFRKYLLERLIHKTAIARFHALNGELDPWLVAREVGSELLSAPVDLAFAGIGENGHLAFNDPPANFDTDEPYLVVTLDQACRQQQVNEGWFSGLDKVPSKAISMSIRQILRAQEIIVVVPEARKAAAVEACFEHEITPLAPASILRRHGNTTVYLDKASSSRLTHETLVRFGGMPPM